MEVHEFYGLFANVPITDRDTLIVVSEGGLLELSDLYRQVDDMELEIRKLEGRQRMLIADSADFIRNHQAGSTAPTYKEKI